MLLTMFLLGLVYVVFVGVLFAVGAGAGLIVIGRRGAAARRSCSARTRSRWRRWASRRSRPPQEPELHGIVERLCVQADLPKPRVCVMETSMPNAFAMGRSKKSTTVCATRGILDLLEPAELEGVMAHELTHVINRDVMVMTLASFFASLAVADRAVRLLLRRRLRQPRRGGGRSSIVVLVSVAVYAISFLLLRALSRYREFAADRGSAVLTGPAQRAGLGAAEDQRHDGARAQPGPARRRRDERVLHHPRADEAVADEHLLRPPAARAAPGGA